MVTVAAPVVGRDRGPVGPLADVPDPRSRSCRSWISAWSSASPSRPDGIAVELLPTFVGCPAVELIRDAVEERLSAFGLPLEVALRLRVPWTPSGSPRRVASDSGGPGSRRPGGWRAAARRSSSSGPRFRVRTAVATDRPENAFGPTQCRAIHHCRPAASRSRRSSRSEPGVIGVVGAGTMGAGIAQVALEAGHEVVLHDVDDTPSSAAAAGSGTDSLAARRSSSSTPIRSTTGSTAGSRGCAGPSRSTPWPPKRTWSSRPPSRTSTLKRTIFRALDAEAPPDAILATNTSALSIDAVADGALQRPERVVGLHFFNPAPVMALVEVGPGPANGPGRRRAPPLRWCETWGKTAVRCADRRGSSSTGSIGRSPSRRSRCSRPGAATSIRHRRGGSGRRLPDGPVRAHGPRGSRRQPGRGAGRSCRDRASGDPLRTNSARRPIQERLVAAGQLGRKTGRGFHRRQLGPAGGSGAGRRSGRRGADRARDRERGVPRGRRRRSGPSCDRPRAPTRRRAPAGPVPAVGGAWASAGDPRGAREIPRGGPPVRARRDASVPGHRPQAGLTGHRTYNPAMTRDLHRPVREAWIVEAVRTPVGRYGGALASVRPDDLAAAVLRAVVDRAGIDPALDRGRDPRLREPGRRGQSRRRADGRCCWPASRSRSAG